MVNVKEDKILYQIKSLDKLIVRNIFLLSDFKKEDFRLSKPTPTQMQILEYVLTHQDKIIYQKDLEEVLCLKRATVSGVLKTMEKNQLLKRENDISDTRTKKIILNEKAKEIFNKNKKIFGEIEKIIKDNISKEELEVFSKVILKMKTNLEKNIVVK